jgi:hypothetical protein
LVLMANVNRYEVGSNTFFQVVKPFIHLKYWPVPPMTFLTHICICSLWSHLPWIGPEFSQCLAFLTSTNDSFVYCDLKTRQNTS